MTTAFITGVTGQDGSYLSEKLLALGWDVHGMVRPGVTGEQPVIAGVTSHVGDLGDVSSLTAMLESAKPDVVFNLAGISSVAQSWAEPALTGAITGMAVGNMLETCRRISERSSREIRFIQASSSEIFGNAEHDPQTESTPLRPTSPYGAAKAYAHHLVSVYRGSGLWAASAILYNHESPRRPPAFVTRKITMGVAAIAQGRADTIELGNLDARRDWGWAADYMDAVIDIARADEPSDYIVATGVTHSVREFVEAAFRRAGIDDAARHIEINEKWNRPADVAAPRGSSAKIREQLGWRPSLGFEEIVSAMVDHDLKSNDSQ